MKDKKTTVGVILSAYLALGWASTASAATRCVKPAGAGGCYASIQAAVTASAAGDTVSIGAGTYSENVVVPAGKDGLKLLGVSRATTILDPDAPLGGAGLAIVSRDVQAANFQVRNGATYGISVDGSGAIIRGVNVNGANAIGVYVGAAAWNVQLLSSEIHNTPIGVLGIGYGLLVKGNTITGTSSIGIYLLGDAGQAVMNQVWNGAHGIYVLADGAAIVSNNVRYMGINGIVSNGVAPTVQRNQVLGTGSFGIQVGCVSCFGGSVAWNNVTDTVSDGINVTSDGPGLVVNNNTLLRTGHGLTVSGVGVRAQVNRVSDTGGLEWAPCYNVYGEQNTLSANLATSCSSSGFYVNGDYNRLVRNIATTTLENGFTVDGDSGGTAYTGNVLTGNQTKGDAAQGFAIINSATSTELTGNKASLNRIDFCDEGGGTVLSGNIFGTTSGACPVIH